MKLFTKGFLIYFQNLDDLISSEFCTVLFRIFQFFFEGSANGRKISFFYSLRRIIFFFNMQLEKNLSILPLATDCFDDFEVGEFTFLFSEKVYM